MNDDDFRQVTSVDEMNKAMNEANHGELILTSTRVISDWEKNSPIRQCHKEERDRLNAKIAALNGVIDRLLDKVIEKLAGIYN